MRIACVLLVVLACGDKRDECTRVKAKIRPVLEAMFRDAGKPLPSGKLDELVAEFCVEPDAPESSKRLFRCVLAANGQPAVAACLQVEFEDYRTAVARPPRADGAVALDDPPPPVDDPPPPVDAGVADAAATKPIITKVDARSLPEWPTKAKGNAFEVFAVDAPGRRLLVSLASGNMLVRSGEVTVTGRVSAPSRQAAFEALAAELGVDPKPARFGGGRGATVDLHFSAAPVDDLLRILADTGRINVVVAPGSLGKVDIVAKRVPWDGVIAQLAVISERTLEKHGNTYYLLLAGTKLPAAPKLASRARIDLATKDATIGEVVAVLQKLTDFPVGACSSARFSLSMRKVTVAEAVRALGVASGATLAPHVTCPTLPADLATLDDLRVTAIASVGTRRAAALERKGAASVVVAGDKGVTDIGAGFVTFEQGTSYQLYPWRANSRSIDADVWIAGLQRISVLIKDGARWEALAVDGTGIVYIDSKPPYSWMVTLYAPPEFALDGLRFDVAPAPVHVPFGREVTN